MRLFAAFSSSSSSSPSLPPSSSPSLSSLFPFSASLLPRSSAPGELRVHQRVVEPPAPVCGVVPAAVAPVGVLDALRVALAPDVPQARRRRRRLLPQNSPLEALALLRRESRGLFLALGGVDVHRGASAVEVSH